MAKSRAWLLPALVGINILAVAGLAGYLILSQRAGVAHASAAHHARAEEHRPRFGPMVDLEPLITNLNDPGAERYVRTTLRLEVGSEAQKAEVEAAVVPIRDRIIVELSSLRVEDTMGPSHQAAIRERLRRIVNETLGSRLVRRVYFVEMVVQ